MHVEIQPRSAKSQIPYVQSALIPLVADTQDIFFSRVLEVFRAVFLVSKPHVAKPGRGQSPCLYRRSYLIWPPVIVPLWADEELH